MQDKLNRLRGMLELDIILLAFLEQQYFQLDPQNQITFETLLTYSDQDLYRWLIKRENVHDPLLQKMIDQVRR
ncbi:FAD assembly factor SdhE [Rickettsiella massiliensis]|uniref:FAD assembly factor SdhE n=1 Tax=Rickettsiella massiliensis TaxID=676517 RepID=UPI00029B21E0|nr:succinate dehydrogenase assembly factor 2 [Rickettsiella massiliensis]